MIERAKQVLAQLEGRPQPPARNADRRPAAVRRARAAPAAAPKPSRSTLWSSALAALHPDEMSPREALEALYALKAQLAKTAS